MPDYTGKYTAVENGQPNYDINELAGKWLNGTITPEEKAYYEQWYGAFNDEETQIKGDASSSINALGERIYENLEIRIRKDEIPLQRKFSLSRWMVAASVILCSVVGAYFFMHQPANRQMQSAYVHDIAPGAAKPILKLANGKTILLDGPGNGLIVQRGNTTINKTGEGQLQYDTHPGGNQEILMDTIEVPAGGKPYLLILSDGSKITLNAATKLCFPESFGARERSGVRLLSGEIYCEVFHKDKIPFRIKTPTQTIDDIGTEFNVSAYPDEPDSRTTLVGGAVKVTGAATAKVIVPGQAAISGNNGLTVAKADVEAVTAWKNGYFSFNGDDIQTIMRQLARWYNIKVKYEGKIAADGFYGKVSRSKNISEVLEMLKKTKSVRFSIEGRRVTVMQ